MESVATSAGVVEAKTGKDAADHLAAGHALDDFVPTAAAVVAPTTLPIHSVADLEAMDLPRPEYIIGPPLALARGTVAELDAYPKHGKTRLVLDAVWALLGGNPSSAGGRGRRGSSTRPRSGSSPGAMRSPEPSSPWAGMMRPSLDVVARPAASRLRGVERAL